MTTRWTPLALGVALLLTAVSCGQAQNSPPASTPPATNAPASASATTSKTPPPPQPPTITIALKYRNENGMCVGRLKDHNDYKHNVMWTTQVTFTVDAAGGNGNGGSCSGFDPTKACVELSSGDVLFAQQMYCFDAMGNPLTVPVSSDMTAVPNNSTHLYSIRYDHDSGGDPELDLECVPCDNGPAGGH